MAESYTCAICGDVNEPGWEDSAARAEFEERFGVPFDPRTAVVICDDCDKMLLNWERTRGMKLHQLLAWLDKAESSAFGECKGEVLDDAVRRQFATISPPPPGRDENFGRVRLTDLGRAELSAARRLDDTL